MTQSSPIAGPMPGFCQLDHVSKTVPDLNAAIDFYTTVFGAEVLHRMGPFDAADMPAEADGRYWTEAHIDVPGARLELAMLQLGPNLMIELFQYDKPDDARKTPPRNCDCGGQHLAFKVENLEDACGYLEQHGCRILSGLIEMDSGPTAGCRARYVVDPWGNYMELMEYGRQA